MAYNENGRDGSTREKAFICRNYDDFLQAINNYFVDHVLYIEFDKYKRDSEGNILKDENGNDILLTQEEKTIDFNDIEPEDNNLGHEIYLGPREKSSINNYGIMYIYGNDWILKNIWTYRSIFMKIGYIYKGKSSFIINKLHFLNFFQSSNESVNGGFLYNVNYYINGTSHYKNNFYFNDCKFSMLFANVNYNCFGYVFDDDDKTITCNRCSFNFRCIGNYFSFFLNNNNHFNFEKYIDKQTLPNNATLQKVGLQLVNCNFRFNLYYTLGLLTATNGLKNGNFIKYCKFSGFINDFHDTVPFYDINYPASSMVNNLYQIKTNTSDKSIYMKGAISEMINSDYSNFTATDSSSNYHFAPINKTGDSNEYLLNIEYLIRNRFPVMSEDEEDDNLI